MILNPILPFSTAKVVSLKATVLLLLTLLIMARVQVVAGSAIGIFLLLLQTARRQLGNAPAYVVYTGHAIEDLPYRIGHGLSGALGLDAAQAGFVIQEVMADDIHLLLVSLTEKADETEVQPAVGT